MAWHYVRDNATQGPVELDELQRLRQQGVIQDETPVWTDGMSEWSAYGKTPAASGAIAPAASGLALATHSCIECGKSFHEDEMLQYEGKWVCASCKPLFFQRLKEGMVLPGTLAYASVGRRFVAILIDGIIVYIVNLVPYVIIGGTSALTPSGQSALGVTTTVLLSLFNLAVGASYEIFLIGKYGATFGKMAMKVKVVKPDGSPISYGRSTGRYFAKMLSGFTLLIGYLMAFWDPERRALHDRLCATRVISTESV